MIKSVVEEVPSHTTMPERIQIMIGHRKGDLLPSIDAIKSINQIKKCQLQISAEKNKKGISRQIKQLCF